MYAEATFDPVQIGARTKGAREGSNMRRIVVLVILVVVGGIAVKGSGAYPIEQVSIAFAQCIGNGSATLEKCGSFDMTAVFADEDFWREFQGYELGLDVPGSGPGFEFVHGDTEGFWREYGGGRLTAPRLQMAPRIFDPL